jgi:hypothetical protein
MRHIPEALGNLRRTRMRKAFSARFASMASGKP